MRQAPRFPIRALAAAAMFALAAPALAQSSNAILRGSVAATGQAAAGAEIVATNTATGFVVRTRSNADGSYALVGVPPGTYKVVANAQGQQTEQTVTLQVGQTVNLDLAVGAAAASSTVSLSTVTVTGALQPDRKTSEVATYVTPQQLARLPQVTRNFLSQADLAPGVNVEYDAEGNVKLRAGASARGAVNVFIDGVGQKDYVLRGGTTGQDNSRGNPFPQSAIGEYKVTSQNYKAEFDQVSSAAISAVTKSGTNQFHGDAFIDHTASNLRAATPAERAAGAKSDTEQQQYGVSAGGPIILDKLHYFVAYEGKDNRDPRAVVARGPLAATSLLPASAQSLLGPAVSPFHEDLIFGKLDWSINDANRVDMSVKVRKERDRKHLGGAETAEFAADNRVDETRFDIKHTYSSDFATNELRLTYENVHFSQSPLSTANGVRYRFLVGPDQNGGYNEQEVLNAGGNDFYQRKGQKGYSLQEDFTWTGLPSHVIKAGVKVKRITVDSIEVSQSTPQFFYDINVNPTIPFRVEFGAPLAGIGDGSLKSKNTQYGVYIQDDWEVNKQLTLNLGVRYDYERSPSYLNYVTPADAVAALNKQDPNAPVGQTYAQTLALGGVNLSDYLSNGGNRKSFSSAVQPRLGFSYDLGTDKRYVLFGGAGRSYDRNVFDILQVEATKGTYPSYGIGFAYPGSHYQTCQTPVAGTNCVAFNSSYYDPATLRTLATGGGGREIDLLNNKLKTPYSDQFSLGFRAAIADWNGTVTLSRIDQKDGAVFLLGNRRPDGSFYAPGTISGPPFGNGVPGQGSLIVGTNGIETKTDSLQLQADKPYTKASKWGVTVAYTYSHSRENHNSQDDFTYLLDYPTASASPMLRSSVVPVHKLVATGTYDLPWGVLGSAKLTLATPKVIRDFNCSAAGCLADTVEKNAFRQFDISIGKLFAVTGGISIGVRLDVINLFDYRNYADYNVDWSKHVATANTAGNLDGPPRTVKVGLNASW